MIGDLVTGRVAETHGQTLSIPFEEKDGAGKFKFIADVLRWRAQTCPEDRLFSIVDTKVEYAAQSHHIIIPVGVL